LNFFARFVSDGADTQHNVGHQWFTRRRVDLLEERGLEKRKLLEPHGVLDQHVEPFEPDSIRASMGRDHLAGHLRPALGQVGLEELGLKTIPAREGRQYLSD